MCLAAMAIGLSEQHPWVLASNRDEFFDRPAAPLAWWRPPGAPHDILSGRDLSAGGTWLGLTRAGRMALVTNVREPGHFLAVSRSRGELVVQALTHDAPARQPQALLQVPRNGFNLFMADLSVPAARAAADGAAIWVTNKPSRHQTVGTGLYGLSNAALDTPWPKVVALKERLRQAVLSAQGAEGLVESALAALADRQFAADAHLPSTGVPLQRERQLSPAFIRIDAADAGGRTYGTRCSTVMVVQRQGKGRWVHVTERSFHADGTPATQTAMHWELPGH